MTYKYAPSAASQDSYIIHAPWKSANIKTTTEFSIGSSTANIWLENSSNYEATSTDGTWQNVGSSQDGSLDAYYVPKNSVPIAVDSTIVRFATVFRYSSSSDDVKLWLLYAPAASVTNNLDGDLTFSVAATLTVDPGSTTATTNLFRASTDCSVAVAAGSLVMCVMNNLCTRSSSNNVTLVGSSLIGLTVDQ